jgi:excisionase family DNA binding protein
MGAPMLQGKELVPEAVPDLGALPLLLTPNEVATLLRISRGAVYQRISRGQLPGVVKSQRSILIMRDALMRAIRKGRI